MDRINDILLTVDACPNACEMWNAIERFKNKSTESDGKAIVTSAAPYLLIQKPANGYEDEEMSKKRNNFYLRSTEDWVMINQRAIKNNGMYHAECQKNQNGLKDAAFHKEKILKTGIGSIIICTWHNFKRFTPDPVDNSGTNLDDACHCIRMTPGETDDLVQKRDLLVSLTQN
ncbi:hypothetical protein Tco_0169893 [Tanacetum coccineum]